MVLEASKARTKLLVIADSTLYFCDDSWNMEEEKVPSKSPETNMVDWELVISYEAPIGVRFSIC